MLLISRNHFNMRMTLKSKPCSSEVCASSCLNRMMDRNKWALRNKVVIIEVLGIILYSSSTYVYLHTYKTTINILGDDLPVIYWISFIKWAKSLSTCTSLLLRISGSHKMYGLNGNNSILLVHSILVTFVFIHFVWKYCGCVSFIVCLHMD